MYSMISTTSYAHYLKLKKAGVSVRLVTKPDLNKAKRT